MQDMNAFNLQLQMHKMCFDILNTMNTDIWNYLNTNRYFECEIKSRW